MSIHSSTDFYRQTLRGHRRNRALALTAISVMVLLLVLVLFLIWPDHMGR